MKTLLADRRKFLTALVGVAFSVVLVNIQGGLFLGLIQKASLLVEHNDADIWVGHKHMQNVDFPRSVPRRWGHRIKSIPGVSEAEPYLLGYSYMTLPNGGYEPVFVVGCDSASLLGNAWCVTDGDPAAIRRSNGVIVDMHDADKIGDTRIGDIREIGRRRVRVVARSEGILGFLVTPYVFMSYRLASEILDQSGESCSYWLVQTEPGVDAEQICAAIRQRIPEAEAYPKERYAWISISFWLRRTGLGISFGAATLLGLVVGVIVVAQTLNASVLDRIAEYGMLKAIGATSGQIGAMLCQQAAIIAAVGSLIGLSVTAVIQVTCDSPRAPILIPWYLSGGSCAVILVICILASAAPYLRVRSLDPATILQE